MKNYLSEAFSVNESHPSAKKLRIVTVADRFTNLRLKDWLGEDSYEVAAYENMEMMSSSQIRADIIVMRIDESLPERASLVEKMSHICDRLLIIGSSSDSELAVAVVRHKVRGYICQQSKEAVCSALSAIAVGGYYVEPEIFKQLQMPHLKASQAKILEWSHVLSIELLSRWINVAISPISVREIFLELGLLRTEKFIFNELIAPAPLPSLDLELNKHIRSLREVSKQSESEFKIAMVCQEINDWVFNSCQTLIRMRVKELKSRKVKILSEIFAPFSNGGTQSLLNYYRDFLKQITQLRDEYALFERESAEIEKASYEAYCKLKGSGIPKIDALCLSYRKKIEAARWRATIEVIEEIIQLLESYIKPLTRTKKLIVDTTKIMRGHHRFSWSEQWLLKDYLNQFSSTQELLVSFEEQLGVPLNAWGQYITLGELYDSMKTFIFPMVEELYQQGIKQAFLK
jgi:hypothetical protein